MTIETVKVAITDVEGHLAVMDFVTVGRGSRLPFGGKWVDEKTGWWRREDSDENILHEIRRGEMSYLKPTQTWRRITPGEIPAARTFRDAWEDGGTEIRHNMPKAREIHRQRLRVARAPLLTELDVAYQRADEKADKDEKARVVALKQELRDLPEHPGIEAAQTTDELKQVWHEALK